MCTLKEYFIRRTVWKVHFVHCTYKTPLASESSLKLEVFLETWIFMRGCPKWSRFDWEVYSRYKKTFYKLLVLGLQVSAKPIVFGPHLGLAPEIRKISRSACTLPLIIYLKGQCNEETKTYMAFYRMSCCFWKRLYAWRADMGLTFVNVQI